MGGVAATTLFVGMRHRRLSLSWPVLPWCSIAAWITLRPPLVTGALLIVPPQAWFNVVQKAGCAGSYPKCPCLYLTGYGGFCRGCDRLLLPTWNHPWFLPWLFVCTALLLVLRRLPEDPALVHARALLYDASPQPHEVLAQLYGPGGAAVCVRGPRARAASAAGPGAHAVGRRAAPSAAAGASGHRRAGC